jgi:hypothetical protein
MDRNEKIVQLTPVEIVTTNTVSGIKIRIVRIEIFQSATLMVEILNQNGNAIKHEMIEINGADYNNWSDDDNYLYKFAANKLGYNLITTVAPTETAVEPVVPTETVVDPVVPTETVVDPVVEPVAPTETAVEPVVPTETVVDPVVPTETVVDPVVEPVAPTGTAVEPVVPTETVV